jgi:predicted transposase/invertase (TIGR01784 family)
MLIQFLNAILHLPVPIRSVTIQNPYSEREFADDKQTIVDVLSVDQNGRVFQIEIQLKMHAALAERLLYTWATAYRSQLTSGATFTTLKPTYSRCRSTSSSSRSGRCPPWTPRLT